MQQPQEGPWQQPQEEPWQQAPGMPSQMQPWPFVLEPLRLDPPAVCCQPFGLTTQGVGLAGFGFDTPIQWTQPPGMAQMPSQPPVAVPIAMSLSPPTPLVFSLAPPLASQTPKVVPASPTLEAAPPSQTPKAVPASQTPEAPMPLKLPQYLAGTVHACQEPPAPQACQESTAPQVYPWSHLRRGADTHGCLAGVIPNIISQFRNYAR